MQEEKTHSYYDKDFEQEEKTRFPLIKVTERSFS